MWEDDLFKKNISLKMGGGKKPSKQVKIELIQSVE